MATRKTTKKKGAAKRKAARQPHCTISPRVTAAAHRLATEGHPPSGRTLATTAKAEKAKRMGRGCVNGTPKTFKLSAAQKRKLSPEMQRGIIAYQRKLGKRIVK